MNKPDKGGDINWVDITQDKRMLVKAGLANRQAMDTMNDIYEDQQIQCGGRGFIQVW